MYKYAVRDKGTVDSLGARLKT